MRYMRKLFVLSVISIMWTAFPSHATAQSYAHEANAEFFPNYLIQFGKLGSMSGIGIQWKCAYAVTLNGSGMWLDPEMDRQSARASSLNDPVGRKQVLIEGRVLIVQQSLLNELGIDWDFQGLGGTRAATTPAAEEQPGKSVGVKVNAIQVRFLQPEPDPTIRDDATKTGSGFTPIEPGNMGSVNQIDVFMFLRAMDRQADARMISAPRITLFNGQRSTIDTTLEEQTGFVGNVVEEFDDESEDDFDDEWYEEDDDDYYDDDEPPPIYRIHRRVPLYLSAIIKTDPHQVLIDTRYVTSAIGQPSDLGIDTSTLGNALGTTCLTTKSAPMPVMIPTRVSTTVRVPDQGTLLLGGLRLANEAPQETGVPMLSKIPVLNRLFSNTSSVKDERELLILVKPTIIIQNESDFFAGEMKSSHASSDRRMRDYFAGHNKRPEADVAMRLLLADEQFIRNIAQDRARFDLDLGDAVVTSRAREKSRRVSADMLLPAASHVADVLNTKVPQL